MTSPADQLGRFCEYGNTDDAKQKKHYKTENKTTPNKIKPQIQRSPVLAEGPASCEMGRSVCLSILPWQTF